MQRIAGGMDSKSRSESIAAIAAAAAKAREGLFISSPPHPLIISEVSGACASDETAEISAKLEELEVPPFGLSFFLAAGAMHHLLKDW
jgi:hypothetical protein